MIIDMVIKITWVFLTGIFLDVRTMVSIFFLEFRETLYTSSLDLWTYKNGGEILKFHRMPEYEAQTYMHFRQMENLLKSSFCRNFLKL